MKFRRSKIVQLINSQIERGFIAAKRLEGWSEKQINKEIEKLTHLKQAHAAIAEEQRKQKEQENNA